MEKVIYVLRVFAALPMLVIGGTVATHYIGWWAGIGCFIGFYYLFRPRRILGVGAPAGSVETAIPACKRYLDRRALTRGITPDGSVLEHSKRALLYELPYMSCESEVEVEIKFIEPLLRALGYSSSDFRVRVPLTMRLGHQLVSGVADWLVFEKTRNRPLCIIEAKARDVPLSRDAVEQARSYAHALSVPYYMITNAAELRIYMRGLPEDNLLFETSVEKLGTAWKTLESIMGAGRQAGLQDPPAEYAGTHANGPHVDNRQTRHTQIGGS